MIKTWETEYTNGKSTFCQTKQEAEENFYYEEGANRIVPLVEAPSKTVAAFLENLILKDSSPTAKETLKWIKSIWVENSEQTKLP